MLQIIQPSRHRTSQTRLFLAITVIGMVLIILYVLIVQYTDGVSIIPTTNQDYNSKINYILRKNRKKKARMTLNTMSTMTTMDLTTTTGTTTTTATTPATTTSANTITIATTATGTTTAAKKTSVTSATTTLPVADEVMKRKSSKTKPPYYPVNGTGVTVEISKDFDPSIFNSFCQNLELALIIPIYSAANNFERRIAIRQTFSKTCMALPQKCKLFFIVGFHMDNSTMQRLKSEYVTEKDILMINKIDTYRDLNNKAVAMVKWVNQNCSSAKFVLHVIDDTYPNIVMFMKILESIQETNYIIGFRLNNYPMRAGKWKVTGQEYPYNIYPTYVAGAAYAFPTSVTKQLMSAFHAAKYCWIEDVWLTGMVRRTCGVKVIDLPVAFQEYPVRNTTFSVTIYYHNVKVEDFYYFYSVSSSNPKPRVNNILSFF